MTILSSPCGETASFRMATETLSMAEWAALDSSGEKETTMATVLFVVKATIRKEREEAVNRWYNEEHVPQVLQFKGLVSARRYKALEGEDRYQYMAVCGQEEEATYRRLMASDHRRALADARVRPHRRFAGRGWIELDVEEPEDVGRALRWLRRAHATATRNAHTETGEA